MHLDTPLCACVAWSVTVISQLSIISVDCVLDHCMYGCVMRVFI